MVIIVAVRLDDHLACSSNYWQRGNQRESEGILTATSRHSEAVFTLHTWSTRVQSVSLIPTRTSSSAPSVSILRSEIATSCEMPRDASTAERVSTCTSTVEAPSARRCARDGAKATRRSAALRSGWNVELPGRRGKTVRGAARHGARPRASGSAATRVRSDASSRFRQRSSYLIREALARN